MALNDTIHGLVQRPAPAPPPAPSEANIQTPTRRDYGTLEPHESGPVFSWQKWPCFQSALTIIDDFLTVGIDSDAASGLFAILANREHRLPTMIALQTGPAHWVAELPDRVAADSIVNRLANNARIINLGQIDMRRHRNDQARAHETYWE